MGLLLYGVLACAQKKTILKQAFIGNLERPFQTEFHVQGFYEFKELVDLLIQFLPPLHPESGFFSSTAGRVILIFPFGFTLP